MAWIGCFGGGCFGDGCFSADTGPGALEAPSGKPDARGADADEEPGGAESGAMARGWLLASCDGSGLKGALRLVAGCRLPLPEHALKEQATMAKSQARPAIFGTQPQQQQRAPAIDGEGSRRWTSTASKALGPKSADRREAASMRW